MNNAPGEGREIGEHVTVSQKLVVKIRLLDWINRESRDYLVSFRICLVLKLLLIRCHCSSLYVGELYTWGREEGDGRLGLGPGRGPDQAGGLSVPCEVKALPVPVSSVSCGGFFTMALTKDGQVWNWGGSEVYIFVCIFLSYLVLH